MSCSGRDYVTFIRKALPLQQFSPLNTTTFGLNAALHQFESHTVYGSIYQHVWIWTTAFIFILQPKNCQKWAMTKCIWNFFESNFKHLEVIQYDCVSECEMLLNLVCDQMVTLGAFEMTSR